MAEGVENALVVQDVAASDQFGGEGVEVVHHCWRRVRCVSFTPGRRSMLDTAGLPRMSRHSLVCRCAVT